MTDLLGRAFLEVETAVRIQPPGAPAQSDENIQNCRSPLTKSLLSCISLIFRHQMGCASSAYGKDGDTRVGWVNDGSFPGQTAACSRDRVYARRAGKNGPSQIPTNSRISLECNHHYPRIHIWWSYTVIISRCVFYQGNSSRTISEGEQ